MDGHELGLFPQDLHELPAQPLDPAFGGENQVVGIVELEDIGDEVERVVPDVYLEVEKGSEAVLLFMDAVDLLEFTDGVPGSSLGPVEHDVFVFCPHEFGHDGVDGGPLDLFGRDAEHILHVPGGGGDDAHRLGVDHGLDSAGTLVVDKLLELLEGPQLINFEAVIDLLEVGLEILAGVEETHLEEVEEHEQVELFAFLEFGLVFFVYSEHPLDIVQFSLALVLQLLDPAEPPGQVAPLLLPHLHLAPNDGLHLLPERLQLEHVFALHGCYFPVAFADVALDVVDEPVVVKPLQDGEVEFVFVLVELGQDFWVELEHHHFEVEDRDEDRGRVGELLG